MKCYNPDKNDDTEEQESFLSKKIPDITEEEKKNGIITIKDQLFFPFMKHMIPLEFFLNLFHQQLILIFFKNMLLYLQLIIA